jgi:hypothetical protein
MPFPMLREQNRYYVDPQFSGSGAKEANAEVAGAAKGFLSKPVPDSPVTGRSLTRLQAKTLLSKNGANGPWAHFRTPETISSPLIAAWLSDVTAGRITRRLASGLELENKHKKIDADGES